MARNMFHEIFGKGHNKVNSAFHPSQVDKMSTRNIWELSGKKETASSKWY